MSNLVNVTVPFIDDMGSISDFLAIDYPMTSYREDALSTINSMRDHDGLPHLKRMPNGTKYNIVFD
jgi:hypothetical protein